MKSNQPVLDFCLAEYRSVKADLIKEHKLSDFDIDYELRYVLFLFSAMSTERSPYRLNFLKKIKNVLDWSVTYEHLLVGKIEKQPSYQLSDIKIAKKSLPFSEILYKFAYCMALQDNHLSSDDIFFLNNFRDYLFAPSNLERAYNIETEVVKLDDGATSNLDREKIKEKANNISSVKVNDHKKSPSLKECLASLEELTGLNSVKEEVKKLVSFLEIQKMREGHGLSVSAQTLHMVFTGAPGTGKTTVARIVAKIYKALGILKKGHLVETDRSGLVGQYVGHTDIKTTDVINAAMGGILFIDEAYSLYKKSGNDFGKEAIDTLVKRLEDDRGRLVVIVAGYKREMDDFINSNPGLRSRFNTYINFENFKSQELIDIFKRLCKNGDYVLTSKAEIKLLKLFKKEIEKKSADFGNGRFVRNTFEKILRNQAMRLLAIKNDISKKDFIDLMEQDIINT
ncbi:Stage V sporulation protein K [hydrothermal vent metagenome]|uniref:Stage V sporulation protein K n=1 Tax=hydrothermal vent metagenome TaxID=652676 RepID=A0A3B1DK35_9ZZZZ